MGGDHRVVALFSDEDVFQSAPPRGGRCSADNHYSSWHHVSIRAPAWGAMVFISRPGMISMCFNPRPRVGGDTQPASARSGFPSFNPRPRVGGDRISSTQTMVKVEFQSAPPRGGRCFQAHRQAVLRLVSIRAPAWGAIHQNVFVCLHGLFQSAPPRGGRFTPDATGIVTRGVSIRAPAWGAIESLALLVLLHDVSIRAPAWGAIFLVSDQAGFLVVSIRAPAWGAILYPFPPACFLSVSIRAPAWGAIPATVPR